MEHKHKWEPVNLQREKEHNYVINCVIYRDWIVTFVCQGCKKLKDEIYKDLK